MLNAVWVSDLGTDEARVTDLLKAVADVDGKPEIEDGFPFRGGKHLLASVDGELVGYAHLDTDGDAFGNQVAELFVHPEHRRKGYGGSLVQALSVKGPLRIWAHGDHPAAAAIAARQGLARARELLVLHTEVKDWPEPAVELRTFVKGQDEQAVIDVNARAFDWHPEQGSLTVEELRATEDKAWFDPEGFFLAEDANGKVIGFHWTKVHAADPKRFGGEPVGEVYVVGVDPAAQGGGLGKALTLAGLRYLRDRGLRQIILYVEGDNSAALAVYSKLGFQRFSVDVQYAG
ncbi:mycothiol synthase [Amycolatopsis sp. cg5]|uniref:mycothiol synthase n=1 Tax=Amycolatopsis sp. cg5 TaxID=3238802 RepID=UPI003523D487